MHVRKRQEAHTGRDLTLSSHHVSQRLATRACQVQQPGMPTDEGHKDANATGYPMMCFPSFEQINFFINIRTQNNSNLQPWQQINPRASSNRTTTHTAPNSVKVKFHIDPVIDQRLNNRPDLPLELVPFPRRVRAGVHVGLLRPLGQEPPDGQAGRHVGPRPERRLDVLGVGPGDRDLPAGRPVREGRRDEALGDEHVQRERLHVGDGALLERDVLVGVLGPLLLLVRVWPTVVLVHEVLHAEEAPGRTPDLENRHIVQYFVSD